MGTVDVRKCGKPYPNMNASFTQFSLAKHLSFRAAWGICKQLWSSALHVVGKVQAMNVSSRLEFLTSNQCELPAPTSIHSLLWFRTAWHPLWCLLPASVSLSTGLENWDLTRRSPFITSIKLNGVGRGWVMIQECRHLYDHTTPLSISLKTSDHVPCVLLIFKNLFKWKEVVERNDPSQPFLPLSLL